MRKSTFSSLLALSFSATVLLGGNALAAEFVVDQHNKSFVHNGATISKLSIALGDTVRFKNEDPFFHNIFSLSDLKTFDLGSFPKGESKTVTFDKAGLIEIECAIHPEMLLELTVK